MRRRGISINRTVTKPTTLFRVNARHYQNRDIYAEQKDDLKEVALVLQRYSKLLDNFFTFFSPLNFVDLSNAQNVRGHFKAYTIENDNPPKDFEDYPEVFECFAQEMIINTAGFTYGHNSSFNALIALWRSRLCAYLWVYICVKTNVHIPHVESPPALCSETSTYIMQMAIMLYAAISNDPHTMECDNFVDVCFTPRKAEEVYKFTQQIKREYSFERELAYCISGDEAYLDPPEEESSEEEEYMRRLKKIAAVTPMPYESRRAIFYDDPDNPDNPLIEYAPGIGSQVLCTRATEPTPSDDEDDEPPSLEPVSPRGTLPRVDATSREFERQVDDDVHETESSPVMVRRNHTPE